MGGLMNDLRRRGVAKLGLAVTLIASLTAGLPLTPVHADGSPQAGAPWPQFKQNGARNSVSPYAGPYTLALKWKINANGAITRGPVIDNDGNIYVATEKNLLYAAKPDGTKK